MHTAILVTDGENQTVTLPKDMQFADVAEVKVMREGERIVLTPKRDRARSSAEPFAQRKGNTLGMPNAEDIDFDPPRLGDL